jgi:hypothetical protein
MEELLFPIPISTDAQKISTADHRLSMTDPQPQDLHPRADYF